jgi:hypothetical protein
MSTKKPLHEKSNQPTTSSEEEIRTLLHRLLELVAECVVEKLQRYSAAAPGEEPPKRQNPGSVNRKGGD